MDEHCMDFEAVYDQFHGPVLRFLARMVTPEETEGVTQEVFSKVARGLAGFQGRARLSTWIYRIATNAALDRLRSRRHRDQEIDPETAIKCEPADVPHAPATGSEPGPLQQVIHTEMNACIREQVDKLPEKYRTVMILNSLEELQNQEIAEILGISIHAVKIRLHRARAMLKQILETQCRFYHNPLTGALACDRKKSPHA